MNPTTYNFDPSIDEPSILSAPNHDNELLRRAVERERLARKDAERLLEDRSRELYLSNHKLQNTADQLRDQVNRNRAIVESTAEGIIVFDDCGIVQTFNPAAERIFGCSVNHALGSHICRFLPSIHFCDDNGCIIQERLVPWSIEEEHAEFQGRNSEGQDIPLDIVLSEVFVGGRRIFAALIRDLARKKQLEAQLAQAQKLESVGQLAAGVAHEINTPIQYVGDNVRFLKNTFDEIQKLLELLVALSHGSDRTPESILAEIQENVHVIDLDFLSAEIPLAIEQALEGADSVSKIVRAMKEFSHPGTSEKQLVDLNRAIESTLTVSRNEWKYFCELELDLDKKLPLVPCMQGELNQAMLNLVINAAHAIQYNQQERGGGIGRLKVRSFHDDTFAIIEIGDNGCGIPDAIRNRIFDPFFTTKPIGKGTGQGLAIAYNVVVKKHRGVIEVDSAEGIGTTFRIKLPLVCESIHEESEGADFYLSHEVHR